MPRLDKGTNDLPKMLVYGKAKTRKTLFCGMLARQGYNVIFLSGEPNMSILQAVPAELHERIHIVQVMDNNALRAARYLRAISKVTQRDKLEVNEDTAAIAGIKDTTNPETPIVTLNPNQLTSNDVLVVDSMTALIQSINVDFCKRYSLNDVSESKDKFAVFGETGAKLRHLVPALLQLPCPVVVIGHEQLNIDDTKVHLPSVQPLTTSSTQGGTIASMFNQVIHFEVTNGGETKMVTATNKELITGGTLLPPGNYDFKSFPWDKVLKKRDFVPTTAVSYSY